MTRDGASLRAIDTAKQSRDWLDRIPAARAGVLAAVSAARAETALTEVGLLKAERVADHRAEMLRRLYLDEGLPAKEVAARLGLTQDHVWSRLRRAGINRARTPSQPLERLYLEERLSLAELGRRFDVDPHVVARNLDRYGIPRDRPPIGGASLEELYVREQLGVRAVAGRPLQPGGSAGRTGPERHPDPAARTTGQRLRRPACCCRTRLSERRDLACRRRRPGRRYGRRWTRRDDRRPYRRPVGVRGCVGRA
jgi:hypothetical protein